MTLEQYQVMRRILSALLAASSAELSSLFSKLSTDSASSAALSVTEGLALRRCLRSLLADSFASPNTPSDADVSAFINQLLADALGSSASAPTANRYSVLRSAFRSLMSDSGFLAPSPSDADTLSLVNASVVAFPATVSSVDIVAWLNGDFPSSTDVGGTISASAGENVRRVNEVTPLTGNWSSPSDDQRPRRDPYGIRFDAFGANLPGQTLVRNTSPAVNLNNTTIVCSFVCRDGTGGPQMGLIRAQSPSIGMLAGAGVLASYANGGGVAFNTLPIPRAARVTAAVRITPTAIQGWTLINGVVLTETQTITITGGQTNGAELRLASGGGSEQGLYGSIAQALIVNRSCTDGEVSQLLTWADAKLIGSGFPEQQPLLALIGDSIPRVGVGASINQGYPYIALANLRARYPGLELCNMCITGSGVSGSYTAGPYFSGNRKKNLLLLASGSNDLGTGVSAATLMQSNRIEVAKAKAAGWTVAIATILPRSGLFSGVTQAQFNAAVAIVNADTLANGLTYADRVIDFSTVSGMGAQGVGAAAGDSSNATNYQSDQVHPTAVGYALLVPPVQSAVAAMLG